MRVRGRRMLALLAGGVVLVGGGVTTLASWQDTEYAGVPLTLSSFDVQTSLDGTNWSSSENELTPKALVIAVNGLLSNAKLTPNGVVTGWVGLRAAPKSMGATVTMSSLALTASTADKGLLSTVLPGGGSAVTYEAVSGVDRDACRSNSLGGGTSVAPAGSLLTTAVTSSAFTLQPGTDTDGGTPVGVCFRLKLANDLSHNLGGASISPVWMFRATSPEN